MKNYSNIEKAKEIILHASNIIIGAGAGLSASGGLDYTNADFTAQCFPKFARLGYTNIMHILSLYWNVNKQNELQYYGVWAKHIDNILYQPGVLEPYQLLKKLLAGKDYFINTTNVDRQFYKVGFDGDRIFAMQGDYGLFQCEKPCSDEVYDNREWIEKIVKNFQEELLINEKDIPYCPKCGAYLIPNLRKDRSFVEKPHLKNVRRYEQFIQRCNSEPIVLLELGVGFNTPSIIRYPFDQYAKYYPDTIKLIRINYNHSEVVNSYNCIGVEGDIVEVLREIASA